MKQILSLLSLCVILSCCAGQGSHTQSPAIKETEIYKQIIRTESGWKAYKEHIDSIFMTDHDAYAYHLQAQYYCARMSFDKAKAYADTSITLAMASQDRETLCKAHWTKANCFSFSSNTTGEIREWKAIIDIGLQPYMNDAKERLAFCYWELGEYQDALNVLPDSLSEEGKVLYNQIIEQQ